MNFFKMLFVYLCRDFLFTKASKYFFEDMLNIIIDSGYGHVTTKVNFTGIESDLAHLNSYAIKVSQYKAKFPNNTYILALNGIVKEVSNECQQELFELYQLVGKDKRPRRFLATLAAVFGIGAVAGAGLFGALSHQDVSDLEKNVENLKFRQDNLVSHQSIQDQAIKENKVAILKIDEQFSALSAFLSENSVLAETDTLTILILFLSSRIKQGLRTLKNAIHSAMDNKVNPDFFGSKFLKKAIRNVQKLLPQNFKLVSDHYIDIYHFETSLVLHKNGFIIVIHVPIYNPSHEFHAKLFKSFPMQINNDSFIEIQPAKPILGLNKNKNEFIEIAVETLQKCNVYNNKHVCPMIKSFRNDFKKSCVYNLYRNNQKLASMLCPKIVSFPRELILEIAPFTFYFILPESNSITEICQNNSKIIPVKNGDTVKISKNCYLKSEAETFIPTKSISVNNEIIFYEFQTFQFSLDMVVKNNSEPIHFDKFSNFQDVSITQGHDNFVSHEKFNIAFILSVLVILLILCIFGICICKKIPASYAPQQHEQQDP